MPFLGSWCDRHRRRIVCIFMPIVGEVFTSIGLMVCTYFFYEFNMEVAVFVESVPLAVSGGWNVMFLGVYTYICSIATDDTRTLRIGMVHVIFSISFMVC